MHYCSRSWSIAGPLWLLLSLFAVRLSGETCSIGTPGKHGACASTAPGEQRQGPRHHSLLQINSIRFRKAAAETLNDTAVPDETGQESEALYSMKVAISSVTGNPFSCRTSVDVSLMSPNQHCPSACPFWAEDTLGSPACRFQCLPALECGSLIANATIADSNGMFCRACSVPNCKTCEHRQLPPGEEEPKTASFFIDEFLGKLQVLWGGPMLVLPEERCLECSRGWILVDGRCQTHHSFVWNFFFVLSIIIMLFFAAWYLHLVCRPITNDEGLEFGLRCRSRTRLHMGADHLQRSEYSQQLWPLTTDLRRMEVAGPGLTLFFNFHSFAAGWALLVAAGWVLTGILVNKDLLVLGTLPASTPQMMCSVTTWGHNVQLSTMWAKVLFTFLVYASTFVASVIHAVFQLRRFQAMDDETTMEDFAAVCRGLPQMNSDSAEEDLSKALQAGTGEHVVGTSICWDYGEAEKHIAAMTQRDMTQIHAFSTTASGKHFRTGDALAERHRREQKERGVLSRVFRSVDTVLGLGDMDAPTGSINSLESIPSSSTLRPSPRSRSPPRSSSGSSTGMSTKNDERSLLRSLKCSGYAFVVFDTEASRDAAVRKTNESGGIPYGGDNLRLSKMTCEPDTVIWTNFSHETRQIHILSRFSLGVLLIAGSLVVWALCIYLPYAYYVCSFSYARGESPGLFASSFFMLMVVSGNQLMYLLCSYVAERVRLWFSDSVEVTYLVLYTFACIVNVVLDMVITFRTTYSAMVGIQARTYNGQRLQDLSTAELFMSYPMQKALGHQLFWYAFPCCFLAPFVLEPLFTIYLPRHISELIVRSNASLRGRAAEEALKFWVPMDLSRYADILLNMSIAVMVLFFPGGYTWKMFGIMWLSHVYIYCYDHYRVLRAVPGFHISGTQVDRVANGMMVIPCIILLSCLIFKIHCRQTLEHVDKYDFIWQAVVASLLHVVVHWLVLVFVVPYFGRPHRRSNLSYEEAASRIPCSWFNANHVHCLRSKYIHRHSPAMIPYVRGKEHLLQDNPEIGAHFRGTSVSLGDSDNVGTPSGA